MSYELRATSYEFVASSMGDASRSVRCACLPVVGSQLAARSSMLLRSSSQLNARSAFTLLELILVLVIVGLGASIAAARLTGMREKVGVEMAAQILTDQARRSQHLAASTGQAVRLRLDLSGRMLDIALMDGANEELPKDGEPARIALSQSADELVIGFARGDAVTVETAEQTIDLIFSPDQRCDPPGTVTFTSASRSASVRLSAGARLPALVAEAQVTP